MTELKLRKVASLVADRLQQTSGATLRFVLAGLVLLFSPIAPAAQDESREISDRWNVRVGALFSNTSTDIAAGNVLGALLRVEDVLGYKEDNTIVGVSGFYRFGANKKGKHSVQFALTALSRDSSGTISGTIPIFDESFVGDFASSYDQRILNLNYRLSLVRTDRAEAGVIAGLSALDFSFSLNGSIQDGMGGTLTASEKADFLAPLPTFGFFLHYALKNNLIFSIEAQALDIKVGDLDGRLLETGARLTWYFIRNLGLGFGLGGTDLNVSNSGSGNKLQVEYRLTTTTLGLSAVF